jgi:hypothetical protein
MEDNLPTFVRLLPDGRSARFANLVLQQGICQQVDVVAEPLAIEVARFPDFVALVLLETLLQHVQDIASAVPTA